MGTLIKKFNPLEMAEAEVLALATGRERLLEIMLQEMQQCLKKGSNQHYILYGPRGIGKSFFTRLLKINHDKSAVFKDSLFIQLPEEQDNINFVADLLDVISILLEGGHLADAKPKWTITTMQWDASVKRLKAAIDNIRNEKNIQHIFFTQENLQVFIPKLDNLESARLRSFLSDFDEITLIGSSLRPDLDNDYNKRLFQVFKKMDIEPWTGEDFLKYYERKATLSHNAEGQLAQIKKSKNKIKAIAKFTGGSPRLAVILSNLILDKNILDTAQLLDGIIDDLTSYYQDITNDIPHKSKILFDMLIRKGENMTQSALAESFDPPLDQSTIARSFSWLLDNYYVIYSKQAKGNTKFFYVRDRLYVLYYQKRQIFADVPYSFVGIFVDFLAEYYTQKEQEREITHLNLAHPYSKPLLYHFAKKANLELDESYQASDIKEKIIAKYAENDRQIHIVKVLKYFDEGLMYGMVGEFKKAIDVFQKVIDLKPDYAFAYYNLGTIFGKMGDFQKANDALQKAIELKPDDASAYNNLGTIFGKMGDFQKANDALQKAIELNPDDASAYYNLGFTFYEMGDFQKAADAYQKAIELKPDDASAYNSLGTMFGKMGDFQKAEDFYTKTIELKPDASSAYKNLGILYYENSDYQKSLEILLQGLENNNSSLELIVLGLAICIRKGFWDKMKTLSKIWSGDESISTIMGNALSEVIIVAEVSEKFYFFKNTIDKVKNDPEINIYETMNALCITLYNNANNQSILEQIVDELDREKDDETMLSLILQVFKYLLHPDQYDINQLHPDVRTVVQSVMSLNKE